MDCSFLLESSPKSTRGPKPFGLLGLGDGISPLLRRRFIIGHSFTSTSSTSPLLWEHFSLELYLQWYVEFVTAPICEIIRLQTGTTLLVALPLGALLCFFNLLGVRTFSRGEVDIFSSCQKLVPDESNNSLLSKQSSTVLWLTQHRIHPDPYLRACVRSTRRESLSPRPRSIKTRTPWYALA